MCPPTLLPPHQGLASVEDKKSMRHQENGPSYRDCTCLLRNYRNWVRHFGILVTRMIFKK